MELDEYLWEPEVYEEEREIEYLERMVMREQEMEQGG